MMKYLIWQSNLGWHVSRLYGRDDGHVEVARVLLEKHGRRRAKKYLQDSGLEVLVTPLDEELRQSTLVDTWVFERTEKANV